MNFRAGICRACECVRGRPGGSPRCHYVDAKCLWQLSVGNPGQIQWGFEVNAATLNGRARLCVARVHVTCHSRQKASSPSKSRTIWSFTSQERDFKYQHYPLRVPNSKSRPKQLVARPQVPVAQLGRHLDARDRQPDLYLPSSARSQNPSQVGMNDPLCVKTIPWSQLQER